jgi:MFS family permease
MPPRARSIKPAKSRAFAGLGAGAPVGTAIGLVLAGLTTQYTSAKWRSFFYICAQYGADPIETLERVFASCARDHASGGCKDGPDREPQRESRANVEKRSPHTLKGLDWIGAILSAVAIFCIVFPLGEGGNAPKGWQTPFIWIILAGGVVVSVLFVLWERRLEKRGTHCDLPPKCAG